MQYKKKGIQKKQKKNNVSHHNKKKSQNKDKFSKNGRFFWIIVEPADRSEAKTEQQKKIIHKNDIITKTINKNIQKTLM